MKNKRKLTPLDTPKRRRKTNKPRRQQNSSTPKKKCKPAPTKRRRPSQTGDTFIPKKNTQDYWSSVLNEVVNLENDKDYLCDSRLFKWGDAIGKAAQFRHIVIYMSVAMNLPKTKGMTQGEYFDKYLGVTSDVVSKSILHIKTLLFLKFHVNEMEELECRDQLLEIGEENQHVVRCYAAIRKDYGDSRVLSVFNECNRLLNERTKHRRVTGTLVEKVNLDFTNKEAIKTIISEGVSDDYVDIELPQAYREQGSTITNHNSSNVHKQKIDNLIEGLKETNASIQELHDDIDSCDSKIRDELLESATKLYQTTRDLLKV